MRQFVSVLMLLTIAAALPACKRQLAPEVSEALAANVHIGGTYYT
jgi:hypothetical protein